MRLSKMELPSAVSVGGKFYAVRTGHPWWFRFAEVVREKNALLSDLDFIYDGEVPADRKEGFKALCAFYQPETELPRKSGESGGEAALDYTADAELIFAGILEQYGIDLFEREVHWHKVLAMISGLHSTRLNEIIGYRLYRKPAQGESYERNMERLKRMWRIESEEEREEAAKAAEREREFFAKLRK